MDERLRFAARLLEGEKMAAVCREFGIFQNSKRASSLPEKKAFIGGTRSFVFEQGGSLAPFIHRQKLAVARYIGRTQFGR